LDAVVAAGGRAVAVLDHVGGVVGDDVQIDLQAARMGGVDEGLELGPRAEVRIHVGEVGDPVAVIAGGLLARRPLHRPCS
jgi:hypothetical protein